MVSKWICFQSSNHVPYSSVRLGPVAPSPQCVGFPTKACQAGQPYPRQSGSLKLTPLWRLWMCMVMLHGINMDWCVLVNRLILGSKDNGYINPHETGLMTIPQNKYAIKLLTMAHAPSWELSCHCKILVCKPHPNDSVRGQQNSVTMKHAHSHNRPCWVCITKNHQKPIKD